MKVHVLQHVPFEGLGSIAAWLETKKAEIAYTRFFEADPLPPLDAIDMLIVMGGPMSVNDENQLPWLGLEKQFIRDAIARDITVLGVCLGAQLIAGAMGARVYRNPVKEIGWFPVQAVPAPEGSLQFPQELVVFHWHGETFDLPKGAMRLAESHACENQAFQLKKNVIGLQFHLEITPASLAAFIENCRGELVPGPCIQSEKELWATPNKLYKAVNILMDGVLLFLTTSSG